VCVASGPAIGELADPLLPALGDRVGQMQRGDARVVAFEVTPKQIG
jgi:hypothetical protein